MTAPDAEQIARVCHAAISELQQVYGDSCPSVPWDSADEESRRSTFASVEAVLAGADAEELHAEWARGKAAEGWRRGPLKDAEARTHPALVPFADLPASEQVKDVVFAAVVRAMSGEQAEEKLRLVREYCQGVADECTRHIGIPCRPEDVRVSAGKVLGIIAGGTRDGAEVPRD